ncbi:hypothetical protein [Aneurinibacillus tyrosinisolvens]|uniref:hypothetical protein n=1 Tax=Aneurinibacillus tyrosinisolvens TaxID=1443435 RepID=UPI000AA3EBCD|nr:hypothetical protein [Aneurinibacillus tyrosinisolvens]
MGGSTPRWSSLGRPLLTSNPVEIFEEQGHKNVIIVMADAWELTICIDIEKTLR